MKKLFTLAILLLVSLNSFSQVFGEGMIFKNITNCKDDSCVSISWEGLDSNIKIEGDTIEVIKMLLKILSEKDSLSDRFRNQISHGIQFANNKNKNKPSNETHFYINKHYRKP